MKNYRVEACLGAVTVFSLVACSGGWPALTAKEVRLVGAEQLHGCENRGSTHVSVVDKLGKPGWNVDRVASELLQLAKNGATQLGGNSILEMTEVNDGVQSFAVFLCTH